MMNWQLIESDEALAQLLDTQRDGEVVVVDTEFMRRNTYYPEVALVQLCFESAPDKAWLMTSSTTPSCNSISGFTEW